MLWSSSLGTIGWYSQIERPIMCYIFKPIVPPSTTPSNTPSTNAEYSRCYIKHRAPPPPQLSTQQIDHVDMVGKGATVRNEWAKASSEMSGRSSTTKAKRFTDQPEIPKHSSE